MAPDLEKKGFLDPSYEEDVYNSAKEVFSKWLQEETTTPEELEEELNAKTENVIGRVLGVTSFSEEEITLFFEYLPDSYNHPVQVSGKPIKGNPNHKVLKEYVEYQKSKMIFPRPFVLLHELGIYMTCVTIPVENISADKLEQNRTILKGKAQETWERILYPGNYPKKNKK